MIGKQFAHYEIQSPLGAGGMGEVFLARDLKLGRSVALKMLPQAFAGDTYRIARFEREARVLAALNHPNIASLFGLEQVDKSHFLVMELVDGETLAERIGRGRLPVDEALRFAHQIAEALEAAHAKGIVHRDLKPANVKINSEGKVKVLDFGLAKALQSGPAPSNLSNSPTISMVASQTGVILGTAGYMSPEQAKGKEADARSDIWSFGVVLLEMLTGRPAFGGETMIEVLGGVVKSDPNWVGLPANLPAVIRTLLRRCLRKDPSQRFREIADVRLQIEDGQNDAPLETNVAGPAAVSQRERFLWAGGLIVALLIGGAIAASIWRRDPEPPVVVRFEIPTATADPTRGNQLAISPDGQSIAYLVDANNSGVQSLAVRRIDSLEASVITGSEGASQPFWSADSRFIAFGVSDKLMKVDATGGPTQTLLQSGFRGRGTWNSDGVIVFPGLSGTLERIAASGGATPSPVLELDATIGENFQSLPRFLPDGNHFLYVSRATGTVAGVPDITICVGSLDSKHGTRLMTTESMAVYASGFLLFLREGSLMAQPFDVNRLELTGEAISIAEGIGQNPLGLAGFDVSQNGTTVYRRGLGNLGTTQLVWLNRSGAEVQSITPLGQYTGLAVSSKTDQVAFHRHERTGGDLWLAASSSRTSQITFNAQENGSPVWSPDGSRIAYGSRRNGKFGIYEKLANGAGEEKLLMEDPSLTTMPMSWSPDGKILLYQVVAPSADWDIWALPLDTRKAYPVLNAKYREGHAQFSPDGRWVAYTSFETGASQIFVESFPPGAFKSTVSDRGNYVRWRHDGKELFYLSTGGGSTKVFAVDVRPNGTALEFSEPHPLFETVYFGGPLFGHAGNFHPWDVSADGQRFLIPRLPLTEAKPNLNPITVIMGWPGTMQNKN